MGAVNKHDEVLRHMLSCAQCEKAFYSAKAREWGSVKSPRKKARAKAQRRDKWGQFTSR